MKKNYLHHIIVVFIFILSGCAFGKINISPIATPGVIYPLINAKIKEYWSLQNWLYNQDVIMFIHDTQNNPKIVLYNWKTNKNQILEPPNISFEPLISYSSDEQTIAYTTGDNRKEILIYDIVEEKIIGSVVGSASAFSPENDEIVLWRERKLIIVDLVTLLETLVFDLNEFYPGKDMFWLSSPIWSPDGKVISFLIYEYSKSGDVLKTELFLVDTVKYETRVIHTVNQDLNFLSWSPDSRLLAFTSGFLDTAALNIFDIENSCSIAKIEIPSIDSVHWSPDGKLILVSHLLAGYHLFDVEGEFGQPYDQLQCP